VYNPVSSKNHVRKTIFLYSEREKERERELYTFVEFGTVIEEMV
jgi:hypothetical protein